MYSLLGTVAKVLSKNSLRCVLLGKVIFRLNEISIVGESVDDI